MDNDNRQRIVKLGAIQLASAVVAVATYVAATIWQDHDPLGKTPPLRVLLWVLHVGAVGLFFGCGIALIAIGLRVRRRARAPIGLGYTPRPVAPRASGYTSDGKPFYPIVGYTKDGEPVTADRAPGFRPQQSTTNTMAIFSLIAAWNFFPLGIIFGHIALSQMKRSGQGGRGLAITGLVVGYLSLGLTAIVVIAAMSAGSHV
ncbi:DUF4190 domain-containing protein [Mycolicibacterium sp. CBMA 226]|uniref:DUF4190 domain-containing protein n=1 Tax=Mycolicibacterium sp. CBMA 226 TaxID=2606611 RepID=UPI001317C961|nr:DUF4190 domain-containing protein [Mycolicibacterium sp. CBMA 226]QGW61097.1 hypothetical protein ICEMyc226_00065 [Mycolicibacterium sp.]